MEFEQLLQLIDVVSKSALNEFKYEEKGISIKMGKGMADVQAEGAPAVEFIVPKKSEKKRSCKGRERDRERKCSGISACRNLLYGCSGRRRELCTGRRQGEKGAGTGNRGSDEADE